MCRRRWARIGSGASEPRSFEEAIAREIGRTFTLAEARAVLSPKPATGVTPR